jgi:hypothetical protein
MRNTFNSIKTPPYKFRETLTAFVPPDSPRNHSPHIEPEGDLTPAGRTHDSP